MPTFGTHLSTPVEQMWMQCRSGEGPSGRRIELPGASPGVLGPARSAGLNHIQHAPVGGT